MAEKPSREKNDNIVAEAANDCAVPPQNKFKELTRRLLSVSQEELKEMQRQHEESRTQDR